MTISRKTSNVRQRGFSLIEAFVAISILLVGIVGPLALANVNLQAGLLSRDLITAYYLAQEAIETVREVRDENFIQEQRQGRAIDWLDGLRVQCVTTAGGNGCLVDGRGGVSPGDRFRQCTNCALGNISRLSVNQTTGEYGHDQGTTLSRFSRHVRIEEIGTRAIVHVHVSFETEFGERQTYSTSEHLTDWSPFGN